MAIFVHGCFWHRHRGLVLGSGNLEQLEWADHRRGEGGRWVPTRQAGDRRLMGAQHTSESPADVFYTFRPCAVNCNAWGWEVPRVLTVHTVNDLQDSTARDQFQPAIDFNSTGNFVVAFYDRHSLANNLQYVQSVQVIDASGTRLGNSLELAGTPNYPDQNPLGQIGDYQDIWDMTYPDGESAMSVWCGLPLSIRSEIYQARIRY